MGFDWTHINTITDAEIQEITEIPEIPIPVMPSVDIVDDDTPFTDEEMKAIYDWLNR